MRKIGKRLILGIPFILLIVEFFHPIYALEEDLGRHLLFGEIIVQTHKIPSENLISYTFPHYPYVLNHWLSEVVYFFMVQSIGFEGLLLFTIGLFLCSFGILYLFVIRKINPLVLVSISIVYVIILFERSTIRPEMFGFLFLSISMVIYYTYRKRFTYLIFLLIPLEILWVNFQINFPFGPVVGACFLLEEIIREKEQILQKKIPRHTVVLFIVLFASTISALINPNVLKGFLYPITGYKDIGHPVKELQSIFTIQTFYPRLSHIAFGIATVILSVGLFFSKKPKVADTLIAAIFVVLGASAVRNIPFFIFATFIACCTHANDVIVRFTKSHTEFLRRFSYSRIELFTIVMLIGTVSALSYYVTSINGFGFGIHQEMKYAADFFIENNIKGPIFNDNDHGQYLAYRLYPGEKVFIDIRESYPATFYTDVYFPMQYNEEVFKKIADLYHFNSIIYSHVTQTPWTRKFISLIVNNPDWALVYLDDSSMILVRNNSQNKDVIHTFGIKRDKVVLHHSDFSSEESLKRLANFFIHAGWENQQKSIFQKILLVNPSSCPVLLRLANLFYLENQDVSNAYTQRYKQVCR